MKLDKKIIYFLILICNQSLIASVFNIDSLLKINQNYSKVDTFKVNLLHKIAKEYINNNNTHDARKITEQALLYSNQIHYEQGIGMSYHILGKVFYYNANNEQAINYWLQAAEIFNKLNAKLQEADALFNLSLVYNMINDNIKAFEYLSKSKIIYEKINSNEGMVFVTEAMGNILKSEGLYDEAIEKYQLALSYRIKNKEPKNLGYLYMYMADAFLYNNNINNAIEYYMKAIYEFEQVKYYSGIVGCLLNLSDLYVDKLDDIEKAKKHIFRAHQMALELKDTALLIPAITNMGVYYSEQKNYSRAREYYEKAYVLAEKSNVPMYIESSLLNLGELFRAKNDFDQAVFYFKKAIDYSIQTNYTEGALKSISSIINVYIALKKFKVAEFYLQQLDSLCRKVNTYESYTDYYKTIYEFYFNQQKYKEAIHALTKHYQYEDSINTLAANRKILLNEINYEYKQRETELKNQFEKEKVLASEKNKKQRMILMFVTSGLLLSIGVGITIFILLQKFKKQNIIISNQNTQLELKNQLIEEQNQLLVQKNKDILDSINYAKRIQTAILPDHDTWYKLIPNSFYIYYPKDIVAGDFFWAESSPFNENDIFIAASDCTGHGVPGAMVSVICSSALTKSLLEDKHIHTDVILNRTREIVVNKLSKHSDEIKDGMDIALIKLSRTELKLQYSGANRPLLIVRDNEILEFKPDKQPIGFSDEYRPFSAHDISLQKNDFIYLFTDGIIDQFGGEKNKKMGTKNFKSLLIQAANYDIFQQKELINQYFLKWKGQNEQTDDVTIIGIKV